MDRKQKRDALFTRNDREPVDLGDGVVVEVRSLTVKEARLLRKQEDHEDYAGLMALCACTYDPQTGEKMFDWPADKDVLESAAMGWVQRLLNEVNVVNGWVQRDDEGNSSKESTPNSDDSGEGVEN